MNNRTYYYSKIEIDETGQNYDILVEKWAIKKRETISMAGS